MLCKNCGNDLEKNYCSQCGQKSHVDRINLAFVVSEFSSAIFQLDRGFLYTVKALSVHPGKSLDEFLNGKRVKYYKPISYVLVLSTFYYLITIMTHQNTWLDSGIEGFINGATENDQNVEVPKVFEWFSKNYAYASILLLPVFSLASYISFYKFGKNYIEHIVINSYISGQQAILYTLFVILKYFIEYPVFDTIPILLTIAYCFWVNWQLFKEGNRVVNIMRSILSYILYLALGLILLFISMAKMEI